MCLMLVYNRNIIEFLLDERNKIQKYKLNSTV